MNSRFLKFSLFFAVFCLLAGQGFAAEKVGHQTLYTDVIDVFTEGGFENVLVNTGLTVQGITTLNSVLKGQSADFDGGITAKDYLTVGDTSVAPGTSKMIKMQDGDLTVDGLTKTGSMVAIRSEDFGDDPNYNFNNWIAEWSEKMDSSDFPIAFLSSFVWNGDSYMNIGRHQSGWLLILFNWMVTVLWFMARKSAFPTEPTVLIALAVEAEQVVVKLLLESVL